MDDLIEPVFALHTTTNDLPLCVICGANHLCSECTLIKIKTQVPDNVIPSRARLTLPSCVYIETMADQNYCIIAKNFIESGTKFGPLEAQKVFTLDSSIDFPLKIFNVKEAESFEYYLNTCDENYCNWVMYIEPAQSVEEQNLICYQENSKIFYITIKDVERGEHLKVWYAPYYALKMNKKLLTQQAVLENNNHISYGDMVEPMVLDDLIKGQQKILARENWTCKFCGQVEKYVAQFANHIRKHYADKQYAKTHCDLCNKTFSTSRLYKRHFTSIHGKTSRIKKKTKNIPPHDVELNNKDVLIGGPLLNNTLSDSMDNTGLILPNVDLTQLSPVLPNNLDNENILLDMSLNVDNLLNDNVKELDHFNFEVTNNQDPYVCDICLDSFSDLYKFLQHLNKHTGKFTCLHCMKVFCRKENLQAHKCNASNFACEICQKRFKLRKHLHRHFESAHNKKFSCKDCNKHYYSQVDLNQHNCSTVPDEFKPKFTCTICNKIFFIKKYLLRHMKTHEVGNKRNGKPAVNFQRYICEICAKEFNTKYGFNHHWKTHTERTLSCRVCPLTFHRVDVLKVHMEKHKEDKTKEQQCNNCDLVLKNARMLSIHRQKQHSNVPNPYKCDKCQKTFTEQCQLVKHKSKRHNMKCRECNQKFDSEALLNIHMFVHTEKYYECPVCHSKMKLRSSLTRHLKKLHPGHTVTDVSQMRIIKPNSTVAIQTGKDMEETAANLLCVQNEVADFENYSCCQSILDNFEDILNGCSSNDAISLLDTTTGNLDKQVAHIQHFEFEDFGIDLQNSIASQSIRDAEICLSMPDITETEQEVTLGDKAYILEDGTIVEPNDTGQFVVYLTKDH